MVMNVFVSFVFDILFFGIFGIYDIEFLVLVVVIVSLIWGDGCWMLMDEY